MRVILLSALFCLPVVCHGEVPGIRFDAWARATAPGATTGAVYGVLENHSSEKLTLAGVEFSGAGYVMVHRTVERDGMMRMIHADVMLAPGDSLALRPGDLHMMLMKLARPLRQGCRYRLTLDWGALKSTHSFVTGGYGQIRKPEQAGEPC